MSEYVANPASPTDAEITAAIKRGLASGSLITAEEFLARVREGCSYRYAGTGAMCGEEKAIHDSDYASNPGHPYQA